MDSIKNFLLGRRLLASEIPFEKNAYKRVTGLVSQPAMRIKNRTVICQRCGTRHLKSSVYVPGKPAFYYCPTCLSLGRVQSNRKLYHLPIPKQKENQRKVEYAWKGLLTKEQHKIATTLEQVIKQKTVHLVHAVTGAGKTEMLFPGIHLALERGERVAICSPRIDVCLELYPRFQEVFPGIDIALLYGGQTKSYHQSRFVICTTHQLLRFYQAFDCLIIDEVDAYPFSTDSFLRYGTKQAVKKTAAIIYLTATPNKTLVKKQQANGAYSQLSRRFHGYPLPVPSFIWLWQWQKKINENKLPLKLHHLLENQIKKKRQTLLFCPTIAIAEKVAAILKIIYPTENITSVASTDPLRLLKIRKMRSAKYRILVTTTILERGVTFRDIDVFVLGSNHTIFQQASLVQIAGRVGRSNQAPSGAVYFFHDGLSYQMVKAWLMILRFNRVTG